MTTEPLAPVPGDPTPHKRVAVVPLALAAVGLAFAIVFTIVVVGLATSTPPSAAPPPPTAVPTAPVEPAPPVDERRAADVNECVDALGDGDVDIDSARVAIDDGRLVTTVQLADALPDAEVTVGIFAVSGSGDAIFQFASTWRGGELHDFFAQRYGVGDGDNKPGRGNDDDDDDGNGNGNRGNDDDDGENDGFEVEDLDTDDVQLDGTSVVAQLPRSVVRELGDDWRWYAFTAVDGVEVDACPGAVQTFETQPFER